MIDKKLWKACIHDAVMFGDKPCPLCDGSGLHHIGQRVYSCDCAELKWKRKTIERILPMRYHRNNLYTLQTSTASKLPLERQKAIIEYMAQKENRDKGYFLYGEPGTSKTTLAAALVRNAIERDWDTWLYKDGPQKWNNLWIQYVNWDNLISQYLAYQNDREAPPPTVTAQYIQSVAASGRCPVLVIEEIDKSKLTQYKANKLFDLVQAMDAAMGQLIITTNYRTVEEFEAFLYKTDDETINLTGEPVWRRIVDNCVPIKFNAEGEL